MATNFPASLDTLTNPTATDTLDSPPHDTQHANANDAIEALQAKVGVNSSAVATSHDYKIGALETDVTNINEVQWNTQAANYTLVLSDAGKIVRSNSGSAITFTVPPESSVDFPDGTQILFIQQGGGQLTIAAGAGVTIRSKDNNTKLSAAHCGATLIKFGADVWYLLGDLTA